MTVTDLMMSVSGIGFLLSLLPAVRDSMQGRTSITLVTSVPTAILLCNVAAALFMLDQTISASITLGTATLWAVLAMQRWVKDE